MMDHRQPDRPRRDAEDLLLNGFWTSRRAQAAPSQPPRPITPTPREHRNPSKSPGRAPKNRPPKPVVEDEADSLAKEHLAAGVKESHLKGSEPPFRGAIDQHPIILESDISDAEAAKLHKKLNLECQATDTSERRFVLIPRGDTHSPIRDDDEVPRGSYTDPKTSLPVPGDTGRRTSGQHDGSAPPLERRRSRQDLPSLQTEMPTHRRSASAYNSIPTSKPHNKSPRTSSGDILLSPDAATGRGHTKGYFDIPTKGGPRNSQASLGTPIMEKRRSAGQPNSRPTTPTTPSFEKRHSTGSDAYGRLKQDMTEKLTRPQLLSTENSGRRSPSSHSHLEPAEQRYRKSSSQSSRRHYTSSDDEQSSSDSERRRSKHRHHHRHHTKTSLHHEDDRDRHIRSISKSTRSSDGKPGSRVTSPLASPNISPSQLPPIDLLHANQPVGNRRPNSRPVSPLSGYTEPPQPPQPPRPSSMLEPSQDSGRGHSRSRSRRSSPVAAPGTRSSTTALPIPIPARIDLHSPGDTRRSPAIPHYDDDRRPSSARPAGTPKPSWQPPPFQPPSDSAYLERPVGSYRRYSQDIDDGTIAPLPQCPRTTLTRGYNDWLTLPRHPSFNICPSCFESTMAPTEFHSHFVPAPKRPASEAVICDFGSQPWYRIAWLLTRKERRRDLALMSQLARIAETTPPCLGHHEANRKWYSIPDPATRHPIRNFDVCLSCVRHIEALLPTLDGLFVRTDHSGPQGPLRVCDMRFDSARFIHYFDALETAADSSDSPSFDNSPELAAFAALAKRLAALPECPRDRATPNAHWHVITQLPEFTVCGECFEAVVRPGVERNRAIPSMFKRDMVRVPERTSCQLYSPRMRGVFARAVEGDDYKFLAARARERKAKEVDMRRELEALKRGRGGVGEKDIRRIEGEWERWE